MLACFSLTYTLGLQPERKAVTRSRSTLQFSSRCVRLSKGVGAAKCSCYTRYVHGSRRGASSDIKPSDAGAHPVVECWSRHIALESGLWLPVWSFYREATA